MVINLEVPADGQQSEFAPVEFGVPQGTVLGSLMFLHSKNKLVNVTTRCTSNAYHNSHYFSVVSESDSHYLKVVSFVAEQFTTIFKSVI